MCGIAGFLLSPGFSLPKDILTTVINKIVHRGPDDRGIYEDSHHRVGLVHARLSIQDLSSLAHQPMISEDGKIVLVFNGEIYNFRELRSKLIAKGIKFKSNSDTEILLNLYIEEGNKMLSQLNGIFAFSIWDQRSQTLFIARDNFGVKPLYYSSLSNGFFFASEIKALAPFLKKKQLNIDTIPSYLTFLWCPGKETSLKFVHKLLPGEAMLVREGQIESCWKWYYPPVFNKKSKQFMSQENAINGSRYHLRNAVYRQMVADVPVGAFLSGGLDSSAIVSFAREQNKDIRCFTIEIQGGQEKGTADDLPYAQKVAKYLNVSLDVVQINSNKMAHDIEKIVKILDEPIADPAALNVLYISELARKQGIKVLLSGAGGDDLFTGYRRHYALMTEYWWTWLPSKVKYILSSFSSKFNQNNLISRRIAKLFSGANLRGDERLVNYFRWTQRDDLRKLYSLEFSSSLKHSNPDREMLNFLKDLPSNISQLDRILALEQQFFLADHNLLYTDRMSMAAGVEVRVPFLDKELVEFAYNIPDRFKQNGVEGKWVLKKALEGRLPNDVIYRPKTGFGVPLRRWMRNELREFLGDTLSPESLRNRGLFDSVAVWKLIADNDKGKIDASYTLFSLLCIEIWCRNFIKSEKILFK
jgi:asparagine synthase (glutamine-hydrolysing)